MHSNPAIEGTYLPGCRHCGGKKLTFAPIPISCFILENYQDRFRRILESMVFYCLDCGQKVLVRNLEWSRL